MRLPLLGTGALLLRWTYAVFADEAWTVDYHIPLLGLPKETTTFFHRPNPASRASLIYTLSEEAVLGAVNPRDGTLVWRQQVSADGAPSNSSYLRAGEGQDVVVSGIGKRVAAWTAADGRLAWQSDVSGPLEDLEILELSDARETPGTQDVVIMTSGEQAGIQRLDGASGAVKWTYGLDKGDIPYQVATCSTGIFGIVLRKTTLGHIQIKVITLDSVSGKKTDQHSLSSLTSSSTIVAVGANSASPIIAWTDAAHTVLKVNILGTKHVSSFEIDKHKDHAVTKVRIHAPSHANSLAHFLVHFETAVSHWGEVYHVDLAKNTIEQAYALPRLGGKGSFSTTNSDANVYFTRVTEDQVTTVSSVSHGILGKWALSDFGVITAQEEKVQPVHSVSEVSVKGGEVAAARLAVVLSTGDWVLIKDGSAVWNRPEVLATTVSATFASPSDVESLAQDLEIEAHSNVVAAYLHRVKRHIQDWQQVPAILSALTHRITNGLWGTAAEGGLVGDVFGFHQVIACATRNGRVVGLDAGSANRIIWSKQAVKLGPGETWKPSFKSHTAGVLVVQSEGTLDLKLNVTTGESVAGSTATEPPIIPGGSVHFTVQDGELVATRPGNSNAGALWKFVPADGERVLSVVPRPVNDPVASIGKVLGDRRVLYKYLSVNLALLVTADDAAQEASVYVLDTVSGAVLFADAHHHVDLSEPFPSMMSENWFAYSYTAESADGSPKGHHLVVGEMFESLLPNDRGPLTGRTNSSSLRHPPEPVVLLHSYQLPEPISQLSVTRTRQGITSRQLLAVLADSGSIVGIPYQILDPRRPTGRNPTKDEQAEGLMRYAPTIEFDPKWYLNHRREVLGAKNVITSPALIESTSLVFAYGLDMFGTRLSPSFSFDMLGKDFNKFQMLATVAALAVATFAVAPLVARKQVNTRWQVA